MNRRLDWIDYAKGLIILALVYGHSLNSSTNAGFAVSRNARATVLLHLVEHDPAVLLRGGPIRCPQLRESRRASFLLERLQRLAYPYLIWSALQATAAILFSAQSQNDTTFQTLLAIPYQPFDQFWFLYALFWMSPVYALTRQLGRWSPWRLAAASIVLFVFPFQTNVLALEMFSVHFVFFAAGALFSPFIIGERQLPELPVWVTALVTAAFVGSSLYIYTHWLDAATGTASHGEHRGYYLYLGLLAGLATAGWAQWLSRRGWLDVLQLSESTRCRSSSRICSAWSASGSWRRRSGSRTRSCRPRQHCRRASPDRSCWFCSPSDSGCPTFSSCAVREQEVLPSARKASDGQR